MIKSDIEILLEDFQRRFRSPNIHGWGWGLKIRGGKITDIPCFFICVYKKLPPDQVPPEEFVPPEWRGFYTDVCQVPQYVALSYTAPIRPVPGGVSADHFKSTAATVCLPVVRDGRMYILGCTHSFALQNLAEIGDPIVQPSPYDGGFVPDFHIGNLKDYIPILPPPAENTAEGALVEVSPEDVCFEVAGYGSYERAIAPCAYGSRVVKVGRTSGRTYGVITSCLFRCEIFYPQLGNCIFVDTIRVVSESCPQISLGGDSGAPVLVLGSFKPVGMLIGGNEYEFVAIKMSTLASLLRFSL
jgi:hypothetical protein